MRGGTEHNHRQHRHRFERECPPPTQPRRPAHDAAVHEPTRDAERDAQVETREPRGFLTGRGEIVYERRGESAEGRFADSHESPREKERHVIRREGARHRGDGPRAEADGDEAKGVRALGERGEHGRAAQEPDHERSLEPAVLVVGYAELALEPRGLGRVGGVASGVAADRRGRHGAAVEVDEQRHEAEEQQEARRGEPGGLNADGAVARHGGALLSFFARELNEVHPERVS